jgi:nitronate monooxygenase
MALAEELRGSLTLPAFAAPMFLVSGTELAIACCQAGIVGSLTRNHCRDFEEMEAQLKTVREALDRFAEAQPGRVIGPLCMNISPTFSQQEFRRHLDCCKRYGVRIVVTSVGDPTLNAPLVQEYGMLHFHDATTIRFAEKAAAAGADGIVCIGAGGGGHAGTISHLAFIPQVRAMFGGMIVMAGAVSTGAVIRAAQSLGADLAYIGTRMIATRESAAPDEYKAMLLAGGVTIRAASTGCRRAGSRPRCAKSASTPTICSCQKAGAPITCRRERRLGATSGARGKASG